MAGRSPRFSNERIRVRIVARGVRTSWVRASSRASSLLIALDEKGLEAASWPPWTSGCKVTLGAMAARRSAIRGQKRSTNCSSLRREPSPWRAVRRAWAASGSLDCSRSLIRLRAAESTWGSKRTTKRRAWGGPSRQRAAWTLGVITKSRGSVPSSSARARRWNPPLGRALAEGPRLPGSRLEAAGNRSPRSEGAQTHPCSRWRMPGS